MDLTNERNRTMFETALNKAKQGVMRSWLKPVEAQFVLQMAEEYEMNGSMMEPTVKQFNWLRQIAFDLEKL